MVSIAALLVRGQPRHLRARGSAQRRRRVFASEPGRQSRRALVAARRALLPKLPRQAGGVRSHAHRIPPAGTVRLHAGRPDGLVGGRERRRHRHRLRQRRLPHGSRAPGAQRVRIPLVWAPDRLSKGPIPPYWGPLTPERATEPPHSVPSGGWAELLGEPDRNSAAVASLVPNVEPGPFRRFVDGLRDCVAIDEDGVLTYLNPKLLEHLGLESEASALGRSMSELLECELLGSELAQLRSAIDSARTRADGAVTELRLAFSRSGERVYEVSI